jgi:23S rRNA pseudouridine1911/1915/1917 synthase
MAQKITFQTSKIIKLNDFLRKELPLEVAKKIDLKDSQCEFSNSKIRRLILSGCVFVNNQKINRPAFELRGNSLITVYFDAEKFFYEKQTNDIDFVLTEKDILFEDQNLIFLNKPAFFPVEKTIVEDRKNLHQVLVDYLWKRSPELRNPPYVGIMHRLDKDTSGVIVFTKNRPANKIISETFQNHNLTKEYIAICPISTQQTQPQTKLQNLKVGDSFTVEGFIGRISGKSSQGKWGFVSEKEGGQFSKTDFIVKSKVKVEGIECFVIKCSLFTGRTHQIRVHLSSKGLSILGDQIYGTESSKSGKRLYLHASRLAFTNELGKYDIESVDLF